MTRKGREAGGVGGEVGEEGEEENFTLAKTTITKT
jgi:hypothetical protein